MSTECKRQNFQLIDSSKHTLNFYQFSIKHMKLSIEPNFDIQTIECIQNLEIICIEDLLETKVELDCAQLNITKILYNEIKSKEDVYELGFIVSNEKLIIKLPKILKKDTVFFLRIEYYAKPKRGFHF